MTHTAEAGASLADEGLKRSGTVEMGGLVDGMMHGAKSADARTPNRNPLDLRA